MTPNEAWHKIVSNLLDGAKELPTVPLTSKKPVWFSASTDGETIFINPAREHSPSSKITMTRKIEQKYLERMYPVYLRREKGEPVSREAGALTVNQVYHYSLFRHLAQ